MQMDLLGTLASWASIVGLLFSVLAFVFSKRASKAAEEARDSVLLKSLSQDMSNANRIASEIVRHVSTERGDMALLRVGELLNEASYAHARWAARLSVESRNNLLRVQEHLLSIHGVLSRKPISELSLPQKTRLAQTCQQVNLILSEEHGMAVKAGDKVG
jgi:hypothetical protein